MNRNTMLLGAAVSAVLTAEAVDISTPCDLATYDLGGATELVFQSTDRATPFWLSEDLDLAGVTFRLPGSKVLYIDLKNKLLKTGGTHRLEGRNAFYYLKDGTVKPADSGWFRAAYWGDTETSGSEIWLDNVSYTVGGSSYYQGFVGHDTKLVLTNGAVFSENSVQNFFKPTNDGTNNLVHVSTGSKLYAVGPAFHLKDSNKDIYTGDRIVVEGVGSYFGAPSTTYAFFGPGNALPSGGSLIYTDHAAGYWGNLICGNCEGSCGNYVEISDGASYSNQQGIVIGGAVGSDRNRLYVLDGGEFVHRTASDSMTVGKSGCYNEYVLSNAVEKSCYYTVCGLNPGANYNLCRVVGQDSSIEGPNWSMKLFGLGECNTWELDDCTIGHMSLRTYMGNGDGAASTNNTFRLVNGAKYATYDFLVPLNCASNTIYVGAGCELESPHDIHVRGLENRMIVSNGTVKVSISGENLRFGVTNQVATAYPERGNRLVFQGTRPRIAMNGSAQEPTSAIKFGKQSVIEFDVPSDGYDGMIGECISLSVAYDTSVRFKGLDALQRRIRHSVDYPLFNDISLINPGAEETLEGFFAKAEGIPAGCTLGKKSCTVNGETRQRLVLHVKSLVGTMVLFR